MISRLLDIKIYSFMDLFTKSLVFAADKHKNQRRKQAGDVPYINHPLEVAHILALAGVKDYEILAAAILHDTV
jgi:guanosine-3',5'-bis(diphosphate) 3'-pyrophosphohydrolase